MVLVKRIHRPSASALPLGSSRLARKRMQDVDRVAHVEALAQPARHRDARVQHKPRRVALHP